MEKNNQLEAMLADYAKSIAPKFTPKAEANVFNENNYFTIYDMKEGQQTAQKNIRILPDPNGGSPISEVWIHEAVVDGKKAKFPCLKHLKDEACPFCEAKDELYATGTETNKEFAKRYKAKKYYIIKLIDRDNEDHGPKFWRFPDAFDKKGPYNMIMDIVRGLKKNQAIMDPETGRDLTLMIGRSERFNVPTVTSIVYQDSDVLSEDAEKQAKWLADDKTWDKVFSIKNYDYLEIVVKGGIPVWDKELKTFVDKNGMKPEGIEVPESESEISMGVENVKANILAAAESTETESDNVDAGDETDDLPF